MPTIALSSVLDRLDTSSLQALYPYDAYNLVLRIAKRQSSEDLQKSLLESLSVTELLSTEESRQMVLSVLQANETRQLLAAYGMKDAGTNGENLRQLDAVLREKSNESHGLDPFFLTFGADPRELEVDDEELEVVVTPFATEAQAGYPLHPYQRDVLNRVVKCYRGDENRLPATRALLHMPTGSGKTRTAMVLACRYLMSHPKGLVIWLADTYELCSQAAEEFLHAWHHLGDRNIPLYRIYGKLDESPDYAKIEHGFVVATLQSATSARRKETEGDLRTLSALASHRPFVIVDEAHKAPAPQYKKTIETLLPVTLGSHKARLLGLSATPGRATNDRDADQPLVRMFGGNIFSLRVEGYPTPIDFLTDEGYLAKAVFRQVPSTISFDTLKLTQSEREGHISKDRLSELLRYIGDDVERNFLIFEELKKLTEKHQRIIFFAASVAQSKRMAYVLRLAGIAAKSVSAEDTTPSERVRTIHWFKTSRAKALEARIICNYGILTTGFDAPETSAVLIGRPTQSLVLYSQMVGRGLRGLKAGGNAEAEIVTVVDHAIKGFSDVSAAFTNWNDSWHQPHADRL